jgi:hypothetical protein
MGFRDIYDRFITLLRDTPAETFIGIALAGAIGFASTYYYEKTREAKVPLAFSGIGKIEQVAEQNNRVVGPATRYLTSVNDAVMKVLECSNLAHASLMKRFDHVFASELEMKIDRSFRVRKQELNHLLEGIPSRADKLLSELEPFSDVMSKVSAVNGHFRDSWNDTHIDQYRTEVYLDTEHYTDKDGNSHSRTVTKTRQVYDHTIHTYTYRKTSGENAAVKLDRLVTDHATLKWKEIMPQAVEIDPEGEYAIDSSRGPPTKRVSEDEYRRLTNLWNTGSTLNQNVPAIEITYNRMPSHARSWRIAKSTSKSTWYITYSSSDSGPKEFRVARGAQHDGESIFNLIHEIHSGIQYSKSMAPLLSSKIQELIAVELDSKPGNSKKLSREILGITREMYRRNFKEGMDIYGFRWYIVTSGGLLAGALGGLAGYGLDRLGEERGWFSRRLF